MFQKYPRQRLPVAPGEVWPCWQFVCVKTGPFAACRKKSRYGEPCGSLRTDSITGSVPALRRKAKP